MEVFSCSGCDTILTDPLSQVALPAHAHQKVGNGVALPALVRSGTYAIEPGPSGPPWRRWIDISVDEAAAQGVFAPTYSVSFGARGAIVVAPGDARNTVLIPERYSGYCCGLDGGKGPNLACAHCGQAVATRIDDCSLWQEVRLAPDAVHRVAVDQPDEPVVDWETLTHVDFPAVEPDGEWDARWEAAAGVALAHLVVASAGMPIAVPDGPLAEVFGRALEGMLPAGPTAKTLALVGPGLTAADPDIALVPLHPQTGQAWQPPGSPATVGLAAEVWTYLAFPAERGLIPATGVLPSEYLRDDPPPDRPLWRGRPDLWVFLDTLARLPAVRQPWLRHIYDNCPANYGCK